MLVLLSLLFASRRAGAASGGLVYPESVENGWDGACADGKSQSPIDLPGEPGERSEALGLNYQSATFSYSGGLGLTFAHETGEHRSTFTPPGESRQFNLHSFHVHTTSEHTANGMSYPLEAHFVHTHEENGVTSYAVVGVFYEFGDASPVFGELIASLGTLRNEDHISMDIDPIRLFGGVSMDHFWTYDGSLTTPPCSEGLLWHVLSEPSTISQEQFFQLMILRGTTNRSNRAVQPLFARKVHLGGGVMLPEDVDCSRFQRRRCQHTNCCQWSGELDECLGDLCRAAGGTNDPCQGLFPKTTCVDFVDTQCYWNKADRSCSSVTSALCDHGKRRCKREEKDGTCKWSKKKNRCLEA